MIEGRIYYWQSFRRWGARKEPQRIDVIFVFLVHIVHAKT